MSDPSVEMLDLGSLEIPVTPDLEVALEVDSQSGQPVSVTLIQGNSVASLQAFAQARNCRLWPEVRDDIVAQLEAQHIETSTVMGRFGTEIRCVMPTQDESGAIIAQPVRFLGIEGDRWFLRVTVGGDAALFDEVRHTFDGVLAGICVNRGTHPAPPGEALPIIMPSELRTDLD